MRLLRLPTLCAFALLLITLPALFAHPALGLTFSCQEYDTVGPGCVVVADLNDDGVPDVVTSSSSGSTSSVSVLLGTGGGALAAKTDYDAGGGVRVGDFNGDATPDLVTASSRSDKVSVIPGRGDGTFGACIDTPTSDTVETFAVGDFNGDGKLDLATTRENPRILQVMLGDGDGTFVAAPQVAVSGRPGAIEEGDFNSDGKADVGVVDYDWLGAVSIYLGHGDGTFATGVDCSVGAWPRGIAVGDFDGDGSQDLATANWGSGDVSVLMGCGDGTFDAKVDFTVGSNLTAVAVGDIDGDGKQDLLSATGGVTIMLGHGDGTFAAEFEVGTTRLGGSQYLALGDMDGDGRLDIVATNPTEDSTSVLLRSGDGTFAHLSRIYFGLVTGLGRVALGDFNSDGHRDIVAGDSHESSVTVGLGQGDGTFLLSPDCSVGGSPRGIAVGDFNADGKQDLVVASWGGDGVGVLLGHGDGTFAAKVDYLANVYAESVAIGDFNGDNWQDLAVSRGYVLLGNGDGTFDVGTRTPYTGDGDVAVGDFDDDGHDDLAIAGDVAVTVLLGNGDGTSKTGVDYPTRGASISIAVGDFNNDGNDDVAAARGTLSVWLGKGDGTLGGEADYDAHGPFKSSIVSSVVVGDFNQDGDSDLATSDGSVNVRLGFGDGTFADGITYLPYGTARTLASDSDFDEDGNSDLAVMDSSNPYAGILFGTGMGTAAAPLHGSMVVEEGARWVATRTLHLVSDVPQATEMRVSEDQGTWSTWQSYLQRVTRIVEADGGHCFDVEYRDASAHTFAARSWAWVDATPPTTAISGADGLWRNTSVTVVLSASDSPADAFGVAYTECSLDDGATWTEGASVVIDPDPVAHTTDGLTLLYRSTDAAGNVEATKSCVVRIDTRGPTTSGSKLAVRCDRKAIFRFQVADPKPGSPRTSATEMVKIKIRNAKGKVVKTLTRSTPVRTNVTATLAWAKCRLARGTYRYKVYATDQAGNLQVKAGGNKLIVR